MSTKTKSKNGVLGARSKNGDDGDNRKRRRTSAEKKKGSNIEWFHDETPLVGFLFEF